MCMCLCMCTCVRRHVEKKERAGGKTGAAYNHMICGRTMLPHVLLPCAKKKTVQRHNPPPLRARPELGIWHHSGENKSPTSLAGAGPWASVVRRLFTSFSFTGPHVHTIVKKHLETCPLALPAVNTGKPKKNTQCFQELWKTFFLVFHEFWMFSEWSFFTKGWPVLERG